MVVMIDLQVDVNFNVVRISHITTPPNSDNVRNLTPLLEKGGEFYNV